MPEVIGLGPFRKEVVMSREIRNSIFNAKARIDVRDVGYMNYTAEKFAEDNHLEYVGNGYDVRIANAHEMCGKGVTDRTKRFSLYEGRAMLLYPMMDGKRLLKYEYYTRVNGELVKVMDNQSAYAGLTNLEDILTNIVWLYVKYIDKRVFIDANQFAVVLLGEVTADYHGLGSLAVTDRTIINSAVMPDEIIETRNLCYNDMLEHFIKWNFSKVLSRSDKLREMLAGLVALMSERKMTE